jgi:hypothetical protein
MVEAMLVLAGGGEACSHIEVLPAQDRLFEVVASDSMLRIDELQAALAPILVTVIGDSTEFVPRADACGRSDGRTCESLDGNVVADAMRATYGVDFAITISGGVRADLTCPTTDRPCPRSAAGFRRYRACASPTTSPRRRAVA